MDLNTDLKPGGGASGSSDTAIPGWPVCLKSLLSTKQWVDFLFTIKKKMSSIALEYLKLLHWKQKLFTLNKNPVAGCICTFIFFFLLQNVILFLFM